MTLRPAAPLYDALLDNLERAGRQRCAFTDYITECCFFGNLLTLNPFGQVVDKPVPLAVKMEELLEAAQRQRELHFERLQNCWVTREDRSMTGADMEEIHNAWGKDVRSWMQDSTLETYEAHMRSGRTHETHKLGKKRAARISST